MRHAGSVGSPLRASRGPGKAAGFTLIELMVVVVVVAILATIAYPSYQGYLLRSRRAAAQAALEQAASQQEQFFLNNRIYSTDLADDLRISDTTEGGYYALTAEPGACGDIAACYQLEAAPQGAQTADACGVLSLTSEGQRLPADCW